MCERKIMNSSSVEYDETDFYLGFSEKRKFYFDQLESLS